ncbi:MAG: hypothetical protein AB9866_11235 [Syntrophobacteraceae bacterium]
MIRSRQYLAALIPQGDGLVLNIMRYHQELRDPSEYSFPAGSIEDHKVSEKEFQIAEMLVGSMTSDWDPQQYHDDYRDALMAWIEKKAASGGLMPAAQDEAADEKEAAKVVDMMDLLKKSVQQAASRKKQEAKPKDREKAA